MDEPTHPSVTDEQTSMITNSSLQRARRWTRCICGDKTCDQTIDQLRLLDDQTDHKHKLHGYFRLPAQPKATNTPLSKKQQIEKSTNARRRECFLKALPKDARVRSEDPSYKSSTAMLIAPLHFHPKVLDLCVADKGGKRKLPKSIPRSLGLELTRERQCTFTKTDEVTPGGDYFPLPNFKDASLSPVTLENELLKKQMAQQAAEFKHKEKQLEEREKKLAEREQHLQSAYAIYAASGRNEEKVARKNNREESQRVESKNEGANKVERIDAIDDHWMKPGKNNMLEETADGEGYSKSESNDDTKSSEDEEAIKKKNNLIDRFLSARTWRKMPKKPEGDEGERALSEEEKEADENPKLPRDGLTMTTSTLEKRRTNEIMSAQNNVQARGSVQALLNEISAKRAQGAAQKKKKRKINIPPRQSDHDWQLQYLDLLKYKRTHGHFFVFKEQNPHLACWIKEQRHLKKLNKLADRRKGWLDHIDFCWKEEEEEENPLEEDIQLEKSKEEMLPAKSNRIHESNATSSEDVENAINDFSHRLQYADLYLRHTPCPTPSWNDRYESLCRFKAKCGFLPAPGNLRDWLEAQKEAADHLLPHQVEKLLELGVDMIDNFSLKRLEELKQLDIVK